MRTRAYSDLTRFHDVLYAHLNLSEADRLRTELAGAMDEQFEIQRQRADDLQAAEDRIRDQIKEKSARLSPLSLRHG
jgi:hypothetical protein